MCACVRVYTQTLMQDIGKFILKVQMQYLRDVQRTNGATSRTRSSRRTSRYHVIALQDHAYWQTTLFNNFDSNYLTVKNRWLRLSKVQHGVSTKNLSVTFTATNRANIIIAARLIRAGKKLRRGYHIMHCRGWTYQARACLPHRGVFPALQNTP